MNSVPSSAATKTLKTNELLENILAYLPVKDLIHSQQVCQQWRALIQRSNFLRQQLFLEPQPTTTRLIVCSCNENLQRSWQHQMISPEIRAIDWELNPCLSLTMLPRDHFNNRTAYFAFKGKENMRILSWPSGTWEDMFVTQPPPKRVQLSSLSRLGYHNINPFELSVKDDDGIRLGHLISIMRTTVNPNIEDIYCRLENDGYEERLLE